MTIAMAQAKAQTKPDLETAPVPTRGNAAILDTYGLKYKSDNLYWQIGESNYVQGWILHISVIRTQIKSLLHAILPLLVAYNIPFKIVKDEETAGSILNGDLGPSQVGKIAAIYPNNEEQAFSLAKELLLLTRHFRGPTILTDVSLGGNIYSRYGSHSPIIMPNALGAKERFIYNREGQLVPDIYQIPFALPAGIQWPFSDMGNPVATVVKPIVNGRYKPMASLKQDTKGNVIKALYFNRSLIVKWCVIKQGKANMLSDEQERDARDRLAWQQELHQNLEGVVPIPRIIDLFRMNDDDYLVMEYIKGPDLYKRVNELNFRGHLWTKLSIRQQLIIVDYILQLLLIAGQLHQKGIVHRDITPVNFLVSKRDRLVLIDIELAYSTIAQRPLRPFQYGTYGFMSPEQMRVEIPTPKEDIYGLGATMITLLTGLPPGIFNPANSRLTTNLNFFVRDHSMSSMLVACLSADPSLRPTVPALLHVVQAYKLELSGHPLAKSLDTRFGSPDQAAVSKVVDSAIRGLVTEPTVMQDGLWYSKAPSQDQIADAQKSHYCKSIGLYEGVSGVLYFLARAKVAGFDISPCTQSYEKGWEYIQQTLRKDAGTSLGFYGGIAGIALALIKGMDAGLVPTGEPYLLLVRQCLEAETTGINAATGFVGQGLAALQAAAYLPPQFVQHLANRHIQLLLNSQQTSGQWITYQDERGTKRATTSFTHGDSGIIWYLLCLTNQWKMNNALHLAEKALTCQMARAATLARTLRRKGFRQTLVELPFADSLTGLVLVLLKAYETLQETTYKRLAEDILFELPDTLVHENFAQESGLAGIGELYLQAYKVLQNPLWLQRAGHTVALLIHTTIEYEKGTCHWLNNNAKHPVADFIVGTSGIIHFLIRYLDQAHIGYRLLE